MAVATVAGAWLALRRPGRHEAWLGAAAGALLVIALLHLLPDAWSAARGAGIWPLAVPAAALGSFALAGLAARRSCACCAVADRPTPARWPSTAHCRSRLRRPIR
jgi:hypothetical protein